jgi:TolB protein
MGISKIKALLLASAVTSVAQSQDLAPVSGTTAAAPRIYIPVGDPNIKKVLMAVEVTDGAGPASTEFMSTVQFDMDFSDLFELLPASKLPVKKGDLDAYRILGVEFLLRSSMSQSGGQYIAEVRLFDVTRGLQILGRRYPLVSPSGQPGRELGHFAANDVVQALTGEQGIFRTRLLMSCGSRKKEIYIMDFDGQNVRQLTRDGNLALSPSWAPDGKRIVFTSYKPAVRGGFVNPNLYMVDLVSNVRTVISAAKGLNTGGAFHPKLNRLAYTFSNAGRPEIFVLDLDAKTRQPITNTQFFSVEPAWSPSGEQISFSSSQTGRPHIYVANANGTSARRLTFAGQYNSSPNWSPKGDRLAFSGQENRANNFNIFLIDPSGSNLARLTDGSQSSENPVFSPDGRFIAFSNNQGGSYRINVMTNTGTRIRALSPPGLGDCKQPSWSPRL